MDNGILVVEWWLISAPEYIAIDITPLWPLIHVDGKSDWSDLINRLVMPSSRVYNHFVNICQEQTLFLTICNCCSWGGGYGQLGDSLRFARVYQLCIPGMNVCWLSAAFVSPCWTRWRVGTGLINTEVSGMSSSDDESTKADIIKRSKITASNWPWFLVVSSTVEGAFNKLSPFVIQKVIVGLADEPKSVLKNQDWFVNWVYNSKTFQLPPEIKSCLECNS